MLFRSRDGQGYAALFPDLKMDGEGILRWKRPLPATPANDKPHRWVILVPSDWQQRVMDRVHVLSGHRGRTEVVDRAQRFFYFPRMADAANKTKAKCRTCQASGDPQAKQQGHLAPSLSGYPFQRIAVDFVGPLVLGKGGY